jgi:hypothetical protein
MMVKYMYYEASSCMVIDAILLTLRRIVRGLADNTGNNTGNSNATDSDEDMGSDPATGTMTGFNLAIVPEMRITPQDGVVVKNPKSGYDVLLTGCTDHGVVRTVVRYKRDRDARGKHMVVWLCVWCPTDWFLYIFQSSYFLLVTIVLN